MFPRTPSPRRDFVTPPPSPAAQSRGGNPVSPTSPLLAAADAPHRRAHTGEPECSPEPPQRGVTSSRRLLRQRLSRVGGNLFSPPAPLFPPPVRRLGAPPRGDPHVSPHPPNPAWRLPAASLLRRLSR